MELEALKEKEFVAMSLIRSSLVALKPRAPPALFEQVRRVLASADDIVARARGDLATQGVPGDDDSVTRALAADIRLRTMRLSVLDGLSKSLRGMEVRAAGGTPAAAAAAAAAPVGIGLSCGSLVRPPSMAAAATAAAASVTGSAGAAALFGGRGAVAGSSAISYAAHPVPPAPPPRQAAPQLAPATFAVTPASAAPAPAWPRSGAAARLRAVPPVPHAPAATDAGSDPVACAMKDLGLTSDSSEAASTLARRREVLTREQRGILKGWFLLHIAHPYPTEEEKRRLAASTATTVDRVTAWFINMRARDPRYNGRAGGGSGSVSGNSGSVDGSSGVHDADL